MKWYDTNNKVIEISYLPTYQWIWKYFTSQKNHEEKKNLKLTSNLGYIVTFFGETKSV